MALHQNSGAFATNGFDIDRCFYGSEHFRFVTSIDLPHSVSSQISVKKQKFWLAWQLQNFAKYGTKTIWKNTLNKHQKIWKRSQSLPTKTDWKNVPLRPTTQPTLPPRITFHKMEKMATERIMLKSKPTNYRKSEVMHLENTITRFSEESRNHNQNKLFGSRITELNNRHYTKLSKSSNFPLKMTFDRVTQYTSIGKTNLFNRVIKLWLPVKKCIWDRQFTFLVRNFVSSLIIYI